MDDSERVVYDMADIDKDETPAIWGPNNEFVLTEEQIKWLYNDGKGRPARRRR